MSAKQQRDQSAVLARTDPNKALKKARSINDPWYRAQALSGVARFLDGDPVSIAKQAAKAASEGEDAYRQSAVRAWEVAALAERGFSAESKKALKEALCLAQTVEPLSSRSEALYSLLQAAFAIDEKEANNVHSLIAKTCPPGEHWRCKRANRDAARMINGELQPRKFFR
ncbi:MAG: hypothetical protein AAF514_06085 [Verrucomicrobiota bacterium]